MPKFIPFVIVFLFYVHSIAQSVSGNLSLNTPLFNKTSLLQHIKTLSSDIFEGRRTGTKGGIKAQKYIVNQFHSLQVKPLKDKYEQPFNFFKNRKEYNGVNILGFVKGTEMPDKYIVISAHYDHEGVKQGKIYNGADDNASGISALFSIAEYLKNNPSKCSVIFAAFDAEELGIQGSKYYLNNPVVPLKNIKANINLDMISRSDSNTLFVVGIRYTDALKPLVLNFKSSNKLQLLSGHDGEDGLENWTYSSDHVSFYKKGIPFLYFGVDDHKDYHEPTDDFENIQPEFYIEAVNTIIHIFKEMDALRF